MKTQILFSSKQMQMAKYKCLVLLMMFCGLLSCKKGAELVNPQIEVKNVYVTFVRSNQIDIKFELSNLGYQTAGVSYYKKSNPTATTLVQAIRENGQLQLSLLGLDPETEYGFKVFYKQNNEEKTDAKEYTTKTLSAELAKYALEVKSPTIKYDEKGNLTLAIEGDNLNNLNLTELDLKVNNNSVTLGYPTLISGSRYQMTIQGVVNLVNSNIIIRGLYRGEEIIFQVVPFIFDGDRYWLNFQPTNLRGYYTSVFNNELYYFYNNQVLKWNDKEERLLTEGSIPEGTVNANRVGLQFDNQLFFTPVEKTFATKPNDYQDFYKYPEAYSYTPATGKWTAFPFKEQNYEKRNRTIQNNNYFVHKDELYLVYTVADDFGGDRPSVTDNYLYHYDKNSKQFEAAKNLGAEIIDYHFVSVNNQLYLLGLVPVYDQGFKVSATFAVFKVGDTFTMEQIYKGGTVAEPYSFRPANVTVYDNKILIAVTLNDFKIFDPADQQLHQVYMRDQIQHMYLGGFFSYNNKTYLNADLLFSSQKIYEISITKGR